MTTSKYQAALHDFITARAAERMTMDDPDAWHPLIGSRYWRLNDAQLAEALADAEITNEIRLTDACTLIAGFLGKSRDYKPFQCARTDGSTQHTMICPSMQE